MELKGLKKVHEGAYLKNYELTYRNKAGKDKIYEIVSRNEILTIDDLGGRTSGISIAAFRRPYPGAAAEQEQFLLLKEFRMGIGRTVYNLCAGMLEENETPEQCIARELYEETGLRLLRIHTILPASYAALAISDVKTCFAFAEVTGEPEDHTSDNEWIEARFYTREEVRELLRTEEFSSRAQLIAYFFAAGCSGYSSGYSSGCSSGCSEGQFIQENS